MRHLGLIALLTLVALLPFGLACNHQPPNPDTPSVGDQVLDCGQEIVSRCASQSLGPINACLGSAIDDPMGCLTGLIGPGICAGQVVIGCLTRASGATARAEAKLNSGNQVSARMADRAEAWIKLRGYTFVGPAPGGS